MAVEFQRAFSKTVDMKWFAIVARNYSCYSTRVFTYYIPLDTQSLSIYVKYVTKNIVVTGHGLKELRIRIFGQHSLNKDISFDILIKTL